MRVPLPCVLAVSIVMGAGCGYKAGVLRHEGVDSIAVPIFEYVAIEQRQGIDRELSKAVAEQMIARSGMKLTTTDEADATLHGRITDYREQVLVRDENNNVVESSIVVTMSLRYVRRDGKVLYRRERMLRQGTFTVVAGQDEADARREAFNDLAQGIVFAMEGGDW